MERKKYNLVGLLLVFISVLLTYAGSIASSVIGAMNGAQVNLNADSAEELAEAFASQPVALSLTISIITLAALIIQIVGVAMLRKVNKKFKAAFVLMMLVLIISVLLVIFAAIFAVVTLNNMMSDANMTPILIMVFVILIVAIVLTVLSLFQQYNMLYGCRDIALEFGDNRLAGKIKKTWRLYMIGFILSLIGLILIPVLLYTLSAKIAAIDFAQLQDPMELLSQFAILVIPLIILVAGGIIEFIAQIMTLVRYIITFANFNGKTPGGAAYAAETPVDAYAPETPVSEYIPEPSVDDTVLNEYQDNNNGTAL